MTLYKQTDRLSLKNHLPFSYNNLTAQSNEHVEQLNTYYIFPPHYYSITSFDVAIK